MTRSRLAVLVSTVVVVLGLLAGLSALWLDPARAPVGPMPGEALVLPADARFVMRFDVKRFTSSPFYARYANQRGMKPEALREIEEKTGLDPSRDKLRHARRFGRQLVQGALPQLPFGGARGLPVLVVPW